jgi:hypothetical protein
VNIAGVVINKVLPEKYQQTKHYMSKVLQDTWGVPLLGCVPDRPFLGCPALMDLETIFGTKLINGEKHRFRHYNMTDINLVTTSLTRFLENLRNKPSRTLYVCHVTRDDLILGFMAEYQRRTSSASGGSANSSSGGGGVKSQESSMFEAALLVCGRGGKYELSEEVKDMIMGMDCAPVCKYSVFVIQCFVAHVSLVVVVVVVVVLTTHVYTTLFGDNVEYYILLYNTVLVEYSTHQAMQKIHAYTPKFNIDDEHRVTTAVEHYEPFIDFDELLKRTTKRVN